MNLKRRTDFCIRAWWTFLPVIVSFEQIINFHLVGRCFHNHKIIKIKLLFTH